MKELFIEKSQGIQGSTLSVDGNIPINSKVGEKSTHLFNSHLTGVAFVMEKNIALNPKYIGMLRFVSESLFSLSHSPEWECILKAESAIKCVAVLYKAIAFHLQRGGTRFG